ncbi:dickkopf-related protein 3b isoform X1 [Eucyclogobius newberryi]|uniref:dickkopf-related protein 3b isoform X1 n=1 Tax=Eucyclogobius newberryi TaxID=166745 RepID=UPI003B5A2082
MARLTLLSLSVVFVALGRAVVLPEEPDEPALSLNEMFRELEELMEDTQHILEEAVDQITTESAKSNSLELHLSHHNGTNDRAVLDKTIKTGNNQTGRTGLSHIHMEVSGQWNTAQQECMVDEDCGELRYCLYEIENSKCLPCIPTDMPCTKDEECCSDQMCVWGQCTVNATSGEEGTICQDQRDCKPELCCAFQRELLFPVCNPRPERGESCLNQPNLLMDMLAWDREGPRDHCPCAHNLQCRPQGRGAVCGD